MKTILFALLMLLYGIPFFAQSRLAQAAYTFPENSTEFIVTFPGQPKLEKMFSGGKSGFSAELYINECDCFLRAESTPLTPIEAQRIQSGKVDLNKTAYTFGESSGLTNITISTGTDKLGLYAKMRGYKSINNVPVIIEIIYYIGDRSLFVVYSGAASTKYPTKETTQFFSSINKTISRDSKGNKDKRDSIRQTPEKPLAPGN